MPIPRALLSRMSVEHARTVRHVFEDHDGWLVMSNAGEFGGGIERHQKAGGAPRSIAIGQTGGEQIPQNVNRAMVIDGVLFVLQGLSHGTSSSGQLAALWREHDHFSGRVVARYRSMPTDWLLQSDGSWLVLTHDAIWQTSPGSQVALAARLPSALAHPSSLARDDDGTLYIGGLNGVLRMRPLWAEHPRYSSDLLVPKGRSEQRGWRDRSTAACTP